MKKLPILIISAAMLLSSCTSGTEYAATVGKSRISADEYTFYLNNVKAQMEGTELSSEEDWQTNEIEGKKAIELAREKALETAVNNVAYIEVGKALGIKMSSEDKKNIEENKKRFVTQMGSEENYKQFLKTQGIDDGFIKMLCESMFYSSELTEKIKEEAPVTDEEISAYFAENEADLNVRYRHAKHILILTKNMTTGEEFSEQDSENARLKAEELLKRVRSGEDFDALAEEFSEDPGLAGNPNGYVFGDGEMMEEFENGTDELAVGETGLVKSSIGYHIILRLPLEESDIKDRTEELILAERLDEKMKLWEEEKNISVEVNDEIISKIN